MTERAPCCGSDRGAGTRSLGGPVWSWQLQRAGLGDEMVFRKLIGRLRRQQPGLSAPIHKRLDNRSKDAWSWVKHCKIYLGRTRNAIQGLPSYSESFPFWLWGSPHAPAYQILSAYPKAKPASRLPGLQTGAPCANVNSPGRPSQPPENTTTMPPQLLSSLRDFVSASLYVMFQHTYSLFIR